MCEHLWVASRLAHQWSSSVLITYIWRPAEEVMSTSWWWLIILLDLDTPQNSIMIRVGRLRMRMRCSVPYTPEAVRSCQGLAIPEPHHTIPKLTQLRDLTAPCYRCCNRDTSDSGDEWTGGYWLRRPVTRTEQRAPIQVPAIPPMIQRDTV